MVAWARAAGLEVLQPERANTRRFRETIAALEPDLGVVVAYGEILTRRLLAVPRLGFVNVHASLLPAYRGAAPIQAAIANGDTVTGVSILQVEPELDSGPLLASKELAIEPGETSEELTPRMAELGAALLVETVDRLEFGLVEPQPQDDAAATYAPKLSREDGEVSWEMPATELHDRLRAYTPWPGVTVEWGGERVKLRSLVPVELPGSEPPGTLLAVEGVAALVRCGGGTAVAVRGVQRPGRTAVTGAEFVGTLPSS